MLSWRAAALHLVALAVLGSVIVAMPIPLNLAALVVWGFTVPTWTSGSSRSGRHPKLNGASLIKVVGMAAIVLAAAFAPVKEVDREKSRYIALPERVMTLAELAEPVAHGWDRFYYCYLTVPEGLADLAVRFPSRELTVGEFIAANEAQTPLRHRFHHCGNGFTILWGGDCSFGLHFRVPGGSKPTPRVTLQQTQPAAAPSGTDDDVFGGPAR